MTMYGWSEFPLPYRVKWYEVWDEETGNMIGDFPTPESAMRFVMEVVPDQARPSTYILRVEDGIIHEIWPEPDRLTYHGGNEVQSTTVS